VQCRQRTKTNSHEVRSLRNTCAVWQRASTTRSIEKRRDG
jgi:hypothetical protein